MTGVARALAAIREADGKAFDHRDRLAARATLTPAQKRKAVRLLEVSQHLNRALYAGTTSDWREARAQTGRALATARSFALPLTVTRRVEAAHDAVKALPVSEGIA